METGGKIGRRRLLAGFTGLAATGMTGRLVKPSEPRKPFTDFALARYRGLWLRHPVLGDPSWDAFEREPGNPIYTGRPPYFWPVNGFLFRDPPSGRWYAFVSVYPRGYWPPPPANCLLMREKAGGGWEEVGLIFEGDPHSFAGDGEKTGAMTDASVVYDGGRYHLLYGWCDPKNARGGLAYASAERPEGPWRCAPRPIHDDARQPPIMGRYVRAYASTLFKRRRDWLTLHMMSTPGNAGGTWALFCMTAQTPEGPYSRPIPLLSPQSDRFHPPLAEFYPAFAHGGDIYAPATSVALNRTFQTVFRAPIEQAHAPDAWKILHYGSVWHAEPVPSEAQGIWGQTFSGQVAPDGTLRAYFTSKNRDDVGTVHLARRPWTRPYRNGFVLSAPRGPAIAVLRQEYGDFRARIQVRASGPWAFCWACREPLGSNHHLADSSLHPLVRTRRIEWRRSGSRWSLVVLDEKSVERVIAQGAQDVPENGEDRLEVERHGARVVLRLNREDLREGGVWSGELPGASGRLELLAETGTILRVERFLLGGKGRPAWEAWLSTEALAGAAAAPDEWKPVADSGFRCGVGHVSARHDSRAKWNYVGRDFRLFAPRGPQYGKCRVVVDGREIAVIDLHASGPEVSAVMLARSLPSGYHAVVLSPESGAIPCDTLEVLPPNGGFA
jgi:hypothetical protein